MGIFIIRRGEKERMGELDEEQSEGEAGGGEEGGGGGSKR